VAGAWMDWGHGALNDFDSQGEGGVGERGQHCTPKFIICFLYDNR